MQSKILICSLCRAKIDWDQQLDEEFLKSWKSFCGNFEEVSTVVTSFLEEYLTQIVPLYCVCLLIPIKRLMDVSFMSAKMYRDTCSFQRLMLVR